MDGQTSLQTEKHPKRSICLSVLFLSVCVYVSAFISVYVYLTSILYSSLFYFTFVYLMINMKAGWTPDITDIPRWPLPPCPTHSSPHVYVFLSFSFFHLSVRFNNDGQIFFFVLCLRTILSLATTWRCLLLTNALIDLWGWRRGFINVWWADDSRRCLLRKRIMTSVLSSQAASLTSLFNCRGVSWQTELVRISHKIL